LDPKALGIKENKYNLKKEPKLKCRVTGLITTVVQYFCNASQSQGYEDSQWICTVVHKHTIYLPPIQVVL